MTDEHEASQSEGSEDEYVESGETVEIVNEFAHSTVTVIHTPKGDRLEIKSPKRGHCIRLDAVELESLSWQDKSIFSEFLEDPHGPE